MSRRFISLRSEPILAFVLAALLGCSDDSSSDSPVEGSGGRASGGAAGADSSSGGSSDAAGGTESSGGGSNAAGQATSGGAAQGGAAGTAATSGGASTAAGAGGAISLGGDASTGGALAGNAGRAAGGNSSTAGKSSTGGSAASAGSAGKLANGGAGVGGSTGTAGKLGTGGATNTGGVANHAGGVAHTGGTTVITVGGIGAIAGSAAVAGHAGTAGAAGSTAVSCPAGATVLCTRAPGSTFKDSDCDGIGDTIEIGGDPSHPFDTDTDGTPDYLEQDADGDGLADNLEVGATCATPRDSDGDKVPDYRDLDSDNNGITDKLESTADTDGDGLSDVIDLDDDDDLLPDTLEIGANPASPLNTDSDGIPDFKDTDSDGDTISDRQERASDPDDDKIPSYRDLDSDNDGIPDAIEAGDTSLATAPGDTDGDGVPDFIDLDSDGDGLLDAVEDKDHDGVVDASESSRTGTDTDGDGVTDLVEVTAGTDPNNAADNPAAHGNFFFTEPYTLAPSPLDGTFDFATKISRADIFFLMDTTGSMGSCISNLNSSLSSTIIPTLASQISSIGIGIGSYRDFPTSPYGSTGDYAFLLNHRIMTVTTAAGIASVQSRVSSLTAGGGNDGYESAWEALHQVATGAGNSTGGGNVAAFNAATAYPTTAVAGETLGTLPGVGFRAGALPIVTYITDAAGHNTDTPSVSAGDYTGLTSVRSTQTINELKAMGARVIGVTPGTTGAKSTARLDQLSAVNATGAIVPPAGWGATAARPVGCSVTQCCTGVSGAGEATDATGNCPLSFLVDSYGSGLGTAIVTAIQVLTTYGTIDISARPVDDPSDSVNAVTAFIGAIVANPTAGASCDSGLTVADRDGDGHPDTFVGVKPGARVCFDVLPKSNVTVSPTTGPQMFKAAIEVVGDSVTVLDTRNVFFLVPPTIQ